MYDLMFYCGFEKKSNTINFAMKNMKAFYVL